MPRKIVPDTRPVTPVLFRITKEGGLIALLPEMLGDVHSVEHCLAYQSDDVTPRKVVPYKLITITFQAKPMQYKLFKKQLEKHIGYRLELRKIYDYRMYYVRMQKYYAAKKAARGEGNVETETAPQDGNETDSGLGS